MNKASEILVGKQASDGQARWTGSQLTGRRLTGGVDRPGVNRLAINKFAVNKAVEIYWSMARRDGQAHGE